jgi:hypothetical protein
MSLICEAQSPGTLGNDQLLGCRASSPLLVALCGQLNLTHELEVSGSPHRGWAESGWSVEALHGFWCLVLHS